MNPKLKLIPTGRPRVHPHSVGAAKAYLRTAAKDFDPVLRKIPVDDTESELSIDARPVEAWRSRDFLVQVYRRPDTAERISINRAMVRDDGHWEDGIRWDEIHLLKKQMGRGGEVWIEIYPPEAQLVNVANIRHLWVVRPEDVPMMWKGGQ